MLYLPTEGLYAEALRRPGLAETLQREFRISLAGPTTLTALLNSLQMGFRTLAIEKHFSTIFTEGGRYSVSILCDKNAVSSILSTPSGMFISLIGQPENADLPITLVP